LIIVLGFDESRPIIGNFTGTGMHGGKIFLRCSKIPLDLPSQVSVNKADKKDLDEITENLKEHSVLFGLDYDKLIKRILYRVNIVLSINNQRLNAFFVYSLNRENS
jgi:glutamate synthase domain-containing protein 3